MGEIIPISPIIWKNFSRHSIHLPQRFLEYMLDIPIYTAEEFESCKQKNIEDIFSTYQKCPHLAFLRYSPTSEIYNVEYGKCNFLYELYSHNLKPQLVRDFSIIYRPNHKSVIMMANIYF